MTGSPLPALAARAQLRKSMRRIGVLMNLASEDPEAGPRRGVDQFDFGE